MGALWEVPGRREPQLVQRLTTMLHAPKPLGLSHVGHAPPRVHAVENVARSRRQRARRPQPQHIAIQHPPATAGFDGEHSHHVGYVLDGGPTLQPRQRCRLTQQLLGAHYREGFVLRHAVELLAESEKFHFQRSFREGAPQARLKICRQRRCVGEATLGWGRSPEHGCISARTFRRGVAPLALGPRGRRHLKPTHEFPQFAG